jgi:hypothetical protein
LFYQTNHHHAQLLAKLDAFHALVQQLVYQVHALKEITHTIPSINNALIVQVLMFHQSEELQQVQQQVAKHALFQQHQLLHPTLLLAQCVFQLMVFI